MDDEKEAASRAVDWRKLALQEEKIIQGLNERLRDFSGHATLSSYQTTFKTIQLEKVRLKQINDEHASIVKEYLAASGKVRTAFIQTLFKDLPENFGKGKYEPEGLKDKPTYDAAWLQEMFDALASKTKPFNEEEEPYRLRYLAYSLQSLHDPIGANQIRHLLALMGDEKILTIAEGVRTDMSAGPVAFVDNAKLTKTDTGDKEKDEEILKEVDGNLFTFLKVKYGKEIAREANEKASEVKDFQVNLDKESYLFPIFSGLSDERLVLFTTPKFMAVHHENGHLITLMQGKGGIGEEHKYKKALVSLTSQEEAYNIFGAPRSDRAYSESTGLPIRFDHKTLISIVEESSSWEQWAKVLAQATHLTGNLPELQKRLRKQIRDLVDRDWSKNTWGYKKTKPKGITAIGKAMDEAKGTVEKLVAAQQSAALSASEKSFWREATSVDFYKEVGGLEIGDAESLLRAEKELARIGGLL